MLESVIPSSWAALNLQSPLYSVGLPKWSNQVYPPGERAYSSNLTPSPAQKLLLNEEWKNESIDKKQRLKLMLIKHEFFFISPQEMAYQ